MSSETPITRDNLDIYLKELGKEYRKRSGTKIPAEIVLIGGAALLVGYGFRELTYDIDAIILASSVMKDAINHVGDRMGLPAGWLNADFQKTATFSDKLLEVSVYYKTFSNILTIRTVAAEYLIAMKLISGRQYKNDLSDIVGILWEHQKNGSSITREAIDKAVSFLYGDNAKIPVASQKTLDDTFLKGDFEKIYKEARQTEIESKKVLLDFDRDYPGELKGENINAVIERARQKKANN